MTALLEQAQAKADAAAARRRLRPQRSAEPAESPSEDAFALGFVENHGSTHRYVPPWHRWLRWDGKRWREDSTGFVYERIRELVRATVEGGKAERSTANASFISGVERLLRTDQRIVVLPDQLDAEPWELNTQSGIVDLRTGHVRAHDPLALCTRITAASVNHSEGADLWHRFLTDITQGDAELAAYLQRVVAHYQQQARDAGLTEEQMTEICATDQIILVGWSETAGRMQGWRFERWGEETKFKTYPIDPWCIAPSADFDATLPMPQGDEDLKRIAKRQTALHREQLPGKAIGGRALCAEITRRSMMIKELCEIDDNRPSA